MYRLKFIANIITALCFAAVGTMGAAAQSQPDSQAGAQLGEQSALAGKQGQGANIQKTTEKSPTEMTTFAAGTVINAELASSVDSKKVKPGAPVNARAASDLKTADGRTILPKGTKIVGHVTQASAKSAGQPDSSLGLAFDKAVLKNGQEISLNAGIQAVGASPSNAYDNQAPGGAPSGPAPGSAAGAPGPRGSGGMNGASSAPPRTADPSAGVSSPDATNSNAGPWDANNHGVVGLHNLSLNSAGDGQGSVITSTGKNVHLDSGTRLILVTGGAGSH